MAAVAVYYKLQQSDIFRSFSDQLLVYSYQQHGPLLADPLFATAAWYTRLTDKYQCSFEGLGYFLEEASFGFPYPEYPQPYDLYSDYQ